MRVATTTLFNISRSGLQKHQTDQARLQEQLSSGRKILTPADDPIASARALQVSQTSSINQQYATNGTAADSALSATEATLAQVVAKIQDLQTLAVNAGNATQTAAEKKMINTELLGKYSELLGLANSTDGAGVYLFSGFQGSAQPFSEAAFGNVSYNGDEGQRKIQISSGRQIPVSENGSEIFQKIKNGNGTFVTAASAGNTGSGVVSPGQVLEPNKWAAVTQKDVKVQFYWQAGSSSAKPAVTYDLVDNATGLSLIDGVATAGRISGPRSYSEGADIEFKQQTGEVAVPAWDYGIKLNLKGIPGSADAFTVKASSNVDLFTTLGQLSTALNNYTPDAVGKGQAAFQNVLNSAMLNLNNALSNVLTNQASIGARMNETQSVQDTNADLQLQYQKTLSGLQDLDYAAAISDFSMNQMLLEATRSSFSKVQDLSLFKYI